MMHFKKFSIVVASLALAVGFVASTASAEDAMPKFCVVNGDEFAARKNPPIEVKHENDSIKVCCKKCARKFEKDPEKYVKKYKEALKNEASSGASAKSDSDGASKPAGSCCSAQ